jgi:hypothetical protein
MSDLKEHSKKYAPKIKIIQKQFFQTPKFPEIFFLSNIKLWIFNAHIDLFQEEKFRSYKGLFVFFMQKYENTRQRLNTRKTYYVFTCMSLVSTPCPKMHEIIEYNDTSLVIQHNICTYCIYQAPLFIHK